MRGTTLEIALASHKKQFSELCFSAHAVICCRVNPAQKAQVQKSIDLIPFLPFSLSCCISNTEKASQ